MSKIKNFLRQRRVILCLCISAGLCLGLFGGFSDFFSPTLNFRAEDVMDKESTQASALLAPIVSAEGAILMRGDTGEVIYEKNADKRLYPASTTKIMTTLLTLEIMETVGADMSSKVKVPSEAVGIEGSSLGLKEGEKVTMEELLYGTMLKSGNDGATCLGICATGNLESFVELMNERAQKLGCKNTKFQNPSGLHHKNHYTTARDLALIIKEAMQSDSFRKIAGSLRWPSKDSLIKAPLSERHFENKNKTVKEYEGATGVKIGYTKASGRTLVASAKRGDIELIAVVLNDSNWFEDAYAMLDYGFGRFEQGD